MLALLSLTLIAALPRDTAAQSREHLGTQNTQNTSRRRMLAQVHAARAKCTFSEVAFSAMTPPLAFAPKEHL